PACSPTRKMPIHMPKWKQKEIFSYYAPLSWKMLCKLFFKFVCRDAGKYVRLDKISYEKSIA
ncbi:MAG: hypothetical protein J5915_06555, partial [Acidaminococcaceae bacterium]|nr:hypothetical protein [Acidaminococcaceae bacterium]